MTVRSFEPSDAEACFRIRSEAFIRKYGDRLGAEGVAALVNSYMPSDFVRMSETMRWFVAEEGGVPVGFCTIRFLDETAAELLFLYVRLDRHGRRIGTDLLRHGEDWLRRHRPEVNDFVLDTVHPDYNQGFYEKMGFEVRGRRRIDRHDARLPAVHMGKSLR
jgi:ribosomal protein S18 acetylase RimI-like enzyme